MTFLGSLGRHEEGRVMASSKEKTIEEVLRSHTDRLLDIPGVVAVALGVCKDRPCIKVYVLEKTPVLEALIPESLEGYPVGLEQAGEIRALPKDGATGP
jgi:hypothetical protein